MKNLWLPFVLILCLCSPAIGMGTDNQCVPADATLADVRAMTNLPGSGVVNSFALVDGVPVVVVDGAAWTQTPDTCQWVFALQMYDPSFFSDTYFFKGGQWYRRYESGVVFPVGSAFSDDFETGSTVSDLLPQDGSLYTSFALLSPLAPTVSEYNALRNCLMKGTCDFLDNRIDFAPNQGPGKSQALKFYAVAPSPEMVTSKSLVERELFHFTKGDIVMFSGWYKAQGGLPFTILDIESSGILHQPGIRITIRNGALSAELKWLDKPQYLQESGSETLFPMDQWVHVRAQIFLSEDEFGKIEIWQDGEKIINQSGRTLPTSESVLDIVQIGITATSQEATLFVDDVVLSGVMVHPKPPRRRSP